MSEGDSSGGTRPFFIAGVLFALTFGAGLGTLVLGSKTLAFGFLEPSYLPSARLAHGYAQVFGFAALFVMGVALHVLPRLRGLELVPVARATWIFRLEACGALVAVLGALLEIRAILIAGALLVIAGCGAFAVLVRELFSRGTPTPQHVEPYLRAGSLWLVAAAVLGALAAVPGAGGLRQPMWEAALWGFAGCWIFGMSLRLLPAHLGLEAVPGGTADRLGRYYQGAVALWVGVAVVEAWVPMPTSRALAGFALVAAGLGFALRLGMLGRRPSGSAAAAEGFQSFVLASYGWLAVALAFGPGGAAVAALAGLHLPPLIADFARHAFTLGFLAQMIMGVALLVVPIFAGARLWSVRLRSGVWVAINLAVVLRGLQVLVAFGGDGAWPWVATSGVFAFLAFVFFTVNLVMSLRGGRQGEGSGPVPAGTQEGSSLRAM